MIIIIAKYNMGRCHFASCNSKADKGYSLYLENHSKENRKREKNKGILASPNPLGKDRMEKCAIPEK